MNGSLQLFDVFIVHFRIILVQFGEYLFHFFGNFVLNLRVNGEIVKGPGQKIARGMEALHHKSHDIAHDFLIVRGIG